MPHAEHCSSADPWNPYYKKDSQFLKMFQHGLYTKIIVNITRRPKIFGKRSSLLMSICDLCSHVHHQRSLTFNLSRSSKVKPMGTLHKIHWVQRRKSTLPFSTYFTSAVTFVFETPRSSKVKSDCANRKLIAALKRPPYPTVQPRMSPF